MRLLIDAHALIWYVDQDHLLSPTAHATITDPVNDLLLSAGTTWEIGIKVGIEEAQAIRGPDRQWIDQAIADLSLLLIADHHLITPTSNRAFAPPSPRPVRSVLVAQALVERLPVISGDLQFDAVRNPSDLVAPAVTILRVRLATPWRLAGVPPSGGSRLLAGPAEAGTPTTEVVALRDNPPGCRSLARIAGAASTRYDEKRPIALSPSSG